MRGSGIPFCSNGLNTAPAINDGSDVDRALANVIRDMIYLSEKLDAFCVSFENARRMQPVEVEQGDKCNLNPPTTT